MNSPKVSIIVPVYNVEKYLPCCMDSLLHQTLTDIEVILVDDESPDNCPAMCDEYAKQDHRVKVVHKKNGGLGYARNSGLEIATGEYIAFVDSDDYVDLETYQKVYSLAIDKKVDVVYFEYQRFNDSESFMEQQPKVEEKLYATATDVRHLMLDMIANSPKAKSDRNIQVSSCCAFYKNELIKEQTIKFKSERELISEDLLFNLHYLVHSSSALTISDSLYYYRENPSSLTHKLRADRVMKNQIFYQYLLGWLESNNFGTEGYLRATRLFIGYSRKTIRRYLKSSLPKQKKIIWLQSVLMNQIWEEVAKSYPYKQLPLKYALHFYLLQRKNWRLLYYYP